MTATVDELVEHQMCYPKAVDSVLTGGKVVFSCT